MSILCSIAKLYVRLVFREDGEFDPAKTQQELNKSEPPRGIAGRCEKVVIPTIKAFWIDREHAENGVLVYLHGGAFYFGPVKEHWDYIARIAKQTGMAAIMIDYGIAPQEPFPVGMEQIFELVTTLDLPEKWFFLGDSSGAAMAVSCCFRLRDERRSMPTGMILMSPWIDATLENPDIRLNEHEDPMMTVKRLASAALIYAGGNDLTDPAISPIFGDLAGLPPVLIQMGTADLLLWDCRKFYQKCLDAGVDAIYEEVPGAFHDFMMLNILPEARKTLKSQAAFLTDTNAYRGQNHLW